MFKKLLNKKLLKNQKGLTLVELLAVIVILAIVAAIAIPAIGNIIENSRYNAVKADAINVLNAANLYFLDEPTATSVTVTQLKDNDNKYLETAGKLEGTGVTATVTKASPNTLQTSAITYSGGKTVTFRNATIVGINENKTKGSSDGPKTVSATN